MDRARRTKTAQGVKIVVPLSASHPDRERLLQIQRFQQAS
jgi:hypothetical protein